MTIEETHKKNFKLIRENSLKVGIILTLKEDYKGFKKEKDFTISHIHSIFGWISFKETEQLPQEVDEILKILKKDTKKNIINNLN